MSPLFEHLLSSTIHPLTNPSRLCPKTPTNEASSAAASKTEHSGGATEEQAATVASTTEQAAVVAPTMSAVEQVAVAAATTSGLGGADLTPSPHSSRGKVCVSSARRGRGRRVRQRQQARRGTSRFGGGGEVGEGRSGGGEVGNGRSGIDSVRREQIWRRRRSQHKLGLIIAGRRAALKMQDGRRWVACPAGALGRRLF
ncbi:hypothetical protein E2562_011787 [Oryza meyeriana var. granulata]|uniref:Uncharacterized protein n=1 Tax=Oryza meyeriana var. granulata TaxID=110450 RepID=A0A6G1CPE7_9ORYZ|nr:hypothetical protein E2562_011787 [Oryza meyeriana var. granulata]